MRYEYERAIARCKDVMPVLFDATSLPESLGAFQWIDFRGVVEGTHDVLAPKEATEREASSKWNEIDFDFQVNYRTEKREAPERVLAVMASGLQAEVLRRLGR